MKLNESARKLASRILIAALVIYDILMLAMTVVSLKTNVAYPFGLFTGVILPMFVLMPAIGPVCGFFALTTPTDGKRAGGFFRSILPIVVQLIANLGICALPMLGLAQTSVFAVILLPLLSLLAGVFGFALPFLFNKNIKTK